MQLFVSNDGQVSELLGSDQKALKIIQLLTSMTDRRLWTQEEDSLIQQLVAKHGTKKWTEVAIEMKQIYPHLARSSKQIRERWHNHLDPHINRDPWTASEEAIVFEAHRKLGSRWKQIANMLVARTDNSVKNHFYSTLRRSLRRMNKFLGFKNSTNQMRVLKPSILGKLIQEGQNSEQARTLINGIFQFSKYKPNKTTNKDGRQLTSQERILYQEAIQRLIDFNSKFDSRAERKQRKSKTTLDGVLIVKKDKKSTTSEELTSKGHDSFEEPHINDEESEKNEAEGQEDWEQSQAPGFMGMLPELELPEEEQDFLRGQVKCQQLFF